ncbi:MAG: hypothetical protein ACREX8_15080, partial [Gammaproteobacteria bacterium]
VQVGTVDLARGMHRIKLQRPGPSAAPGDAWRGELGPVALESSAPPRLTTVMPAQAERLCGREWDWIELVRP